MTEPNFPVQPVVPTPTAPAPIITAKKRSSGGATNLVLVLAALVAVGGLAFAGGRATAPASSTAALGANPNGAFPGGNGYGPTGSFTPGVNNGTRPGGMTLTGTVSAVDGSTLTITTSSGSTVTVDTSSATYHRQSAATSSDVTTGSTVQVSVSGGAGFPGGAPGSSAAPGASAAPAASAATGATTVTATDVTITK